MKHQVKVYGENDTSLALVSALLLYQSGGGDVYATSHPLDIDPDQPHRKVIGAGVPLTKASLAEFARSVHVTTSYAGFVPDNLLYTSPNMLAWWTPAALRPTWFRSPDPAIGTAHGQAAHPAMVFVVVPGDWYVFAVRTTGRPLPSTPLFHSPHFNVWNGGRICTGNVKLPAAPSAEVISEYEHGFFRSRFTHPNRERAVKYKGGMKALWRDQLANPDPAAMNRSLVPAKETLQEAIARITSQPRNA